MATLELSKDVGDLQEPELLPEDWYPFVLIKDPVREKNKKAQELGADAEGAGENFVLNLECLSDDERFARRPFTLWLSLPNPSDEGRRTKLGQTMEDFKLSQIVKVVEGFTGEEVSGSEVSLTEGMMAQFYVRQRINQNTNQLENNIDLFAGVRPIGNAEGADPYA